MRKWKWAGSSSKSPEMGIRHQRYKGVPDDVSNTSRLHHERIAFVLFFYSEFNKFTDRMLEITGIKSFSETIDDGDQPSFVNPEQPLETFIGDATAHNPSSNSEEETIGLTGWIIKPLWRNPCLPHTH